MSNNDLKSFEWEIQNNDNDYDNSDSDSDSDKSDNFDDDYDYNVNRNQEEIDDFQLHEGFKVRRFFFIIFYKCWSQIFIMVIICFLFWIVIRSTIIFMNFFITYMLYCCY
jgi:hypothetical protein